jgi:hypothetical protein
MMMTTTMTYQWCGSVRVVETSKRLEPTIEESQELPIPMVINGACPNRRGVITRNVIQPLMSYERRKLEAIHVFGRLIVRGHF